MEDHKLRDLCVSHTLVQPVSFELADAILKFAKKKLGTPFANPF